MAKRKSFTRQVWEECQRNKRERRRLEEARKRRDLVVEREQRQQRRDRQREREAAERRKRQKAQELDRKDAAQKRQYDHIMAEQGAARAKAQTADIEAVIAAIESILTDRRRDLAEHHSRLVDAVAAGDTGVVGDTVQAVLASSTYPTTVPVECQVHYKAEAGELLIDCELPRHDVVPAVASYRYIKTKKELRPTARTETSQSWAAIRLAILTRRRSLKLILMLALRESQCWIPMGIRASRSELMEGLRLRLAGVKLSHLQHLDPPSTYMGGRSNLQS